MMTVAINGYGRIGRVAHRVILQSHSAEIKLAAINVGSSGDLAEWAHLLKHDTNYRTLAQDVVTVAKEEGDSRFQSRDDYLGNFIISGQQVLVFSQKDPSLLPWKDLAIDTVFECTGHFLTADKAQLHINAGAKKVIISAPSKDDTPTFVLGVNATDYAGQTIISDASCTTNCIASIAQIMEKTFGVEKAMMTTIHAYTADQELQDGGNHDMRRARAAAQNIVPTSTGATQAAAKTVPQLKDKFSGMSIRVPVSVGSLSDFTFLLKRNTTVEEVNDVLTKAAQSDQYKKYLGVTTEPLVSSDIIGNTLSSLVDLNLTQVVGDTMVKIVAWYDNEWGYANRLVEIAIATA